MAALQAVHTYYGIDTQKEQQKLLQLQARAEKPKAEEAEARGSELANFVKTGQMGPLMMKDAGYVVQPGQAGTEAPQEKPQVVPIRNTMAAGDNSVSDAGSSPLVGHVQKISEFADPQTAPQSSSGPIPKRQAGAQLVSLPGGGTAIAEPGLGLREQQQKYQNEVLSGQQKQLEIQKMGQEMGLAAQEARRKGTSELDSIREKFLNQEPVKEARNQYLGAQSISKSLLSGNEISEQMAQTQLPMLALGVKRLSGSVISEAESKQTLDVIKNLISQKGTGHLTPKELSLLNNAARNVEQSALQQLDSLGTESAQAASSAGVPKNPDFIKNKVFFPQGLKQTVPVTRVKVHPQTGKASIFKQQTPGQWDLVSTEE